MLTSDQLTQSTAFLDHLASTGCSSLKDLPTMVLKEHQQNLSRNRAKEVYQILTLTISPGVLACLTEFRSLIIIKIDRLLTLEEHTKNRMISKNIPSFLFLASALSSSLSKLLICSLILLRDVDEFLIN